MGIIHPVRPMRNRVARFRRACRRGARRASTTASGVMVVTGCGVSAGVAWALGTALLVFISFLFLSGAVKAGGNDSTCARVQAATGWKEWRRAISSG